MTYYLIETKSGDFATVSKMLAREKFCKSEEAKAYFVHGSFTDLIYGTKASKTTLIDVKGGDIEIKIELRLEKLLKEIARLAAIKKGEAKDIFDGEEHFLTSWVEKETKDIASYQEIKNI